MVFQFNHLIIIFVDRCLKTKNNSKHCEHKGHKLLSSSQFCTLKNFIMTCEHLLLYENKNGTKKYPLVNKSSMPEKEEEKDPIAFDGKFLFV